MSDKNLLLIVDRIEDGGAEKALIRLGEELLPFFNNVYITSNFKTKKNISKLKLIPVTIESSHSVTSKIITLLKFIFHVNKIKRKKRITHSISFLERSNIVNCITNSSDIKIISTRNNLVEQYKNFNFLSRSGIRLAISAAYLRANKVVALSGNIRNQLIRFLIFPKEVITVYNGYDMQKYSTLAQKYANNLDFDTNKINLIAVGRLAEQKGLDILIEAVSIVKERNIQLRIFGEGPNKTKYDKLINRLSLEDCISIYEPTDKVLGYLEKSDIFVFCSRWEGFGNALAEAIILKKVIVTSDCAFGPSEMLGYEYGITTSKIIDSAVIYKDPMGDDNRVNSLAHALDYAILNFKQLADLSSKPARRFEECFSNTRILDRWLDILGIDTAL